MSPRPSPIGIPIHGPDKDARKICGVILTGIEGQGKSSLAKRLSERLGWAYREADDVMKTVSGRELHETRNGAFTDDQLRDFEKTRGKFLRQLIIETKPLDVHVVATTLRPVLLNAVPKASDGAIVDVRKIPADLKRALNETWIVIHLRKNLDDVAQWFWDNPAALQLRSRLRHCNSMVQVRESLEVEQRILEPLYAAVCDHDIDITGKEHKECIPLILERIILSTLSIRRRRDSVS